MRYVISKYKIEKWDIHGVVSRIPLEYYPLIMWAVNNTDMWTVFTFKDRTIYSERMF